VTQQPPDPGNRPDAAALERELAQLKGPAREKVIRALARLISEQKREAARLDGIRKMKR
jgi:hypothetical protein